MNQNLIKILISLLVITAIIFSAGCNDTTVNGDTDISFPEEGEVSFLNHVQPFMRVRCAYSGCHDDIRRAGGRAMTDYNTYFGTSNLGLIVAGNPDASLLIQVVEGDNLHLFRLGQTLPTENQQNGLRRWIEQGALLN